jgi:hypothetical protein
MITVAAVLFALAAMGGLTLAYLHTSGKRVPVPFGLVHGAFAAAGLVTFVIGLAGVPYGGLAIASVVLFLAAAGGGLVLFTFHLRSRTLPRPLIALHGLLAAAAFVFLLIFIVFRI